MRRLHSFERAAWDGGAQYICGVDEVGRGPLAGPVAACAIVIAKPLHIEFLNDSKVVTSLRRAQLADSIRSDAICFALGWATPQEIDRVNILAATKLAMSRAIASLARPPCQVFVDALSIPDCPYPQQAIVDGDAKSAAIAAASIVAKVARDAHMAMLDALHRGYGFAHNKGYGTAAHLAALAKHGPCPEHRRSFAPVMAPTLALAYDGDIV
ncbi:MAG: ribonuclease HII [Candidatus Eremiobacteraeota bacterium]|nr:ribonuclease HII [Candidatus Eremiobacteraeota bacterium]MBC5828119.1 ribonuclease HII [Candidatus Eremiobacteraeota bacterium]